MDNPKVTSKRDRMHGRPRAHGQVDKPGGVAKPPESSGHVGANHTSYREGPGTKTHYDPGEGMDSDS